MSRRWHRFEGGGDHILQVDKSFARFLFSFNSASGTNRSPTKASVRNGFKQIRSERWAEECEHDTKDPFSQQSREATEDTFFL